MSDGDDTGKKRVIQDEVPTREAERLQNGPELIHETPLRSTPGSPSHLTTSGAASLASASSLPPPLLSRSSLKSSATQSKGAEHSTPPSLLANLTETTQRIRLSPSLSRPHSYISSASTDPALEEPTTLDHAGASYDAPLDNIGSTSRTELLTRRLRSAIGDELLLHKGDMASSAGGAELVGSSKGEGHGPSAVSSLQEAAVRETTSPSTSEGWSWSTFTTLPSSLRPVEALKTIRRASGADRTDEGSEFDSNALVRSTDIQDKTDFSFGSYMKPLDVRRWWSATPGSSSSRDTSRDRSAGMNSRPGSLIADDERSIRSAGGTKKSPTKPESQHPLKGLPVGSFPSSSVAKRNKKKREQLQRDAKGKEKEDLEKNSREGNDVIEHDLSKHHFGVQDGKEHTRFPEREYLVLSTAGKPIFISYVSKARLKRGAEAIARRKRRQTESTQLVEETEAEEAAVAEEEQRLQDDEDQKAATRVGVLQALISNYDKLGAKELQQRSKEILELPQDSRICYLLRPPLYLVATSRWSEDETTLSNHLEYLYLAIISLVTASKLQRLFDRAANFDLKRLLEGTDGILDHLLTGLQLQPTPLFDSLQSVRLDASLRSEAGTSLLPTKDKVRPQDALYALLVTHAGVVTLAKRKKKSIHPVDCHLLVNTVYATKAMKEAGTQSWVPICLPNFASQGYLYAHVSFLEAGKGPSDSEGEDREVAAEHGVEEDDTGEMGKQTTHEELALVLMTSNPDGFEEMSQWQSTIIEMMQSQRLLARIIGAVRPEQTAYSVDELRLPGLRHFIFKWRANLQATAPRYEEPYEFNSDDQRRLVCLYGMAYDFIYRKVQADGKGEETIMKSRKDGIINPDTTEPLASSGSSSNGAAPPSPLIKPKSVLADVKMTAPQQQTLSNSSLSLPALAPKRKIAVSGQHLLRTDSENVFAWSTSAFEVYLAVGTHMPRNAIINIARSIVKWVKQEEGRLFVASPYLFD